MSLYVHCPACPRILRPRSNDPEACWASLKQHLKTVGSRCASHKRAREAFFARTPARCPVCSEGFSSAKEAVIHCCSAPDEAHVAFRSAPPARMDAHEAVVREQKEAAVITAALKLASKMYAAAKSGRSDEVMAHLRNGADPNGGGEDGFTPLMTACEAGHEAVVDVILNHGACQINQRNRYGQTALCLAAINGRTAVVLRLLQDEGVDVECVGGGLSVAEKARKAGFTGLADILAHAATNKQVGKILLAVTEGCASGTFDSLTQRVETLSTGLGAVRRERSEDEVAVYSDKLCTVCLTQPIEMVITPCFHACLCAQCAGALPPPFPPNPHSLTHQRLPMSLIARVSTRSGVFCVPIARLHALVVGQHSLGRRAARHHPGVEMYEVDVAFTPSPLCLQVQCSGGSIDGAHSAEAKWRPLTASNSRSCLMRTWYEHTRTTRPSGGNDVPHPSSIAQQAPPSSRGGICDNHQ